MLANRLSKNPKWNVLLIEAGKVETFVQNIPVIAAFLQPTEYNWGYVAEAQEGSCLGENAEKSMKIHYYLININTVPLSVALKV